MSYEGYEEFLCQNGHYWTVDAMTMIHGDNEEKDKARICAVCHHKAVYVASVDETNGVDVDIPETMPAPKKLIGYTDIPCTDHHGNKYFGKANCYEPVFDNPRQMYKRINAETGICIAVNEPAEISVKAEIETVPQVFKSTDSLVVDALALKQVLHALNGPAYYIRELQATRNLPGNLNPINVLIRQYNAWVESQHSN